MYMLLFTSAIDGNVKCKSLVLYIFSCLNVLRIMCLELLKTIAMSYNDFIMT